MIITICGSLSFWDEMVKLQKKLEGLGHVVFMPIKIEGVDYQSKNLNRVEVKKKFELISEHMEKIKQSNAIVVANFTKGEIENYIGANTFAEICFAYYCKKYIFLLNRFSNQDYIRDEMLAIDPVILNNNFDSFPINGEKICDNKSVGILVWKNDELLLIERKRKPFGFAPPAGHVDENHFFANAADSELQEKVGLVIKAKRIIAKGRKENPCRRNGGSWHYWKIYEATTENHDVKASPNETKQFLWCSKDRLKELALRTEKYLAGKITEDEWQSEPGLEPVWKEWFTEMGIL